MRRLIALCVTLLLIMSVGAFAKDKPVTLVVSIRGFDNPYHANYAVGAKALGEQLGLPVDVLSTEADSQKGIADIRAEVAKTGGNMVLSIDPNQAPDAVPIAKILENAHVYWFNWWNRPNDLYPWNFKYWVAHATHDHVACGYFNAVELFKTFKTPYKGKIIALQGQLANNAAIGRFEGLQKALKEYPNVKLLQWEGADWDTTKAYNATKTMLVAHPDIDGVWSANDNMALGVVQALREAKLAGKVQVNGTDGIPEIFDLIKSGVVCSTTMWDAKYQSMLGLSMALAAKNGTLKVDQLKKEQRCFVIPGVNVTKANVAQIVHDYIDNTPKYDLTNFWAKYVKPDF
jgi:ribose transport system substrate-binding protein